MSLKTFVSIIIPTYNRASLIGKTIESIISQTYEDWECIIVDDYSTDETEKIIYNFCQNDNRIKFVKNQKSKGANGARNTGLEYSIGEFICFFDSDDIMNPKNLEKKIYYLLNNLNKDIVTSYSNVLNENGSKVDEFCWVTEGHILNDLILGKTYVDTNSALIRRKKLTNNLFWDEKCPSYQEFDFHIRVSHRAIYGFIPEFLIDYYRRKSGTISSDKIKDLKGRIFILNKFKELYLEIIGIEEYNKKKTLINKEIKGLNLSEKLYFIILSFKNRISTTLIKLLQATLFK